MIHKLVEGRDLIMGGVKIPMKKDCWDIPMRMLLHVVMDALLGARIGRYW